MVESKSSVDPELLLRLMEVHVWIAADLLNKHRWITRSSKDFAAEYRLLEPSFDRGEIV